MIPFIFYKCWFINRDDPLLNGYRFTHEMIETHELLRKEIHNIRGGRVIKWDGT